MKFCINCMAKIRDTKDTCPFCGQVQSEGVKSSFHLLPGFTLGNGKYLVGKAVTWDGFSVLYIGRDLISDSIVSIQEYMPESIVRRQAGSAGVKCVSENVIEDYQRGLQSFVETADLMKQQAELMVNIVRVLDCFYENGTGYVIAEYINSQSVQNLLENGHIFTWDSAKQVVDAVLEGVMSLHQAGIYHQDIHPGCILITADGQIKLASPGGYRYLLIGKKIQRAAVVRDGYSAEEQYRNKGEIGAYTDVYGVGAVMYHMISGKKPPSAASRLQEDSFQISKELKDSIPRDISNALLNSMQVLQENRTVTPRKFQKELSDKKVERTVPRTNTGDTSSKKTIAVVAAAVIGLCILGTAMLGAVIKNKKIEKEVTEGKESLVPNLCGLSMNEAEELAEKEGFQVVEWDRIPSDQPMDYVVSQVPDVNRPIGEDNTVELTLSGSDQTVMVPDLRGHTEEEASNELEKRKLVCNINRRFTTGGESEKIAEGAVIAVNINGNDIQEGKYIVEQRTPVGMEVSLGDYETKVLELTIPDLKGMTLEEARKELQKVAEETGQKETVPIFTLAADAADKEYSSEVPEGGIISQNIKAGKKVRSCDQNGNPEKISVILSLGPRIVIIPDVKNRTESDAKDILERQGLQVSVREEYSSSISAGQVIGTAPEGGKEVREGDAITLRISKGVMPPPVKIPEPAPDPTPESSDKPLDPGFG